MTRRADAHRAFIAALEQRYGTLDAIASTCRSWSSATYTGNLHSVRCSVDTSRAEDMTVTLSEADLPMPGHFVADVTVNAGPETDGRAELSIEALTIEEVA